MLNWNPWKYIYPIAIVEETADISFILVLLLFLWILCELNLIAIKQVHSVILLFIPLSWNLHAFWGVLFGNFEEDYFCIWDQMAKKQETWSRNIFLVPKLWTSNCAFSASVWFDSFFFFLIHGIMGDLTKCCR